MIDVTSTAVDMTRIDEEFFRRELTRTVGLKRSNG